jgi:hypothetical protein
MASLKRRYFDLRLTFLRRTVLARGNELVPAYTTFVSLGS